MEGCIVVFVDANVLLFKALQFVLILRRKLHHCHKLRFKLIQVGPAPFNVFLGLQEENLLLFVVRLHRLGKCVFTVFEHLNENFKFLIKL